MLYNVIIIIIIIILTTNHKVAGSIPETSTILNVWLGLE